MSPVIAALLGAIQGLTEFLPVSSSGHVTLGALLFELKDLSIGAVLIVHVGTLLATLLVLRKDIVAPVLSLIENRRSPLAAPASREAVGIVLGTIPTGVIGLLLRDGVEDLGDNPHAIAVAFLITAMLLVTTRLTVKRREDIPLWAYVVIGVVQGLAVFPGISRSGSTIAAAMFLGIGPAAAFRISFLLSIPAIAGAALLEASHGGLTVDMPALISGAVAFLTGWGSLLLLRSLVTHGRLWWFALYLVPVAIAVLALL